MPHKSHVVAESAFILAKQCLFFLQFSRSFQRRHVAAEAPDLHKVAGIQRNVKEEQRNALFLDYSTLLPEHIA